MDEVQRVRNVYADYRRQGRNERWRQDRSILTERRSLLAQAIATLPSPPSAILDVGCGSGDLLDDLVAAGIDRHAVVGIDLQMERLEVARRDHEMSVALASGTDLPFADRSFDLVAASTVLSSVGSDELLAAIAGEIGRVLRPGGALLVFDIRLPNPSNRQIQPMTSARLRKLFDGWQIDTRTCILLPPLARRFAPDPGWRYDCLSSIGLLRSHRISVLHPPLLRKEALAPLPKEPVPSVSVILPVRNEGPFIERSLGAVLAQQGVPLPEVIVVDGASDDGTPEAAAEIARRHGAPITVVSNPRRIVPVSMNLGLQHASGQVIVRVDGHCVIAPDYLQRCLEVLAETGEACVGGPMETVGETTVARSIAAAQSSVFGVGGVAFRTSARAGFVDTLAFGAYRREVFERIGGFDEALVRNQDDELNLRLARAGGRIWMDPSVRSTYFSRGTMRGLWRQYHGYGFYKVRVMRKHRTVPAVRHLVPAAFVAGLGWALAISGLRRSALPAAAVLVPYATALAVSTAAADHEGTKPAQIALATATMHTAYGLGWWAGAARELARSLPHRSRRTDPTK